MVGPSHQLDKLETAAHHQRRGARLTAARPAPQLAVAHAACGAAAGQQAAGAWGSHTQHSIAAPLRTHIVAATGAATRRAHPPKHAAEKLASRPQAKVAPVASFVKGPSKGSSVGGR